MLQTAEYGNAAPEMLTAKYSHAPESPICAPESRVAQYIIQFQYNASSHSPDY